MTDKYTGAIGPADAMSALAPQFMSAYATACDRITNEVREFERVTGRLVDGIAIERLDVTNLDSTQAEFIRQVSIHFLPKPSEVAW